MTNEAERLSIFDRPERPSDVVLEMLQRGQDASREHSNERPDPRLKVYEAGSYTAAAIAEANRMIARGELVAALFKRAIPADVCDYATAKLDAHADKERYSGAPSVGRIGKALYEVQFSRADYVEYFARAQADLEVSRGMFPPGRYPLDELRLALDDQWSGRVGRLRLEEGLCGLGLLRFVDKGGEILPHNDVAAADAEYSLIAQSIDTQIAFNLLIQSAEHGGATRVYPRRLSRNEYDANRRPAPEDYALRDECLPPYPVIIRPEAGDIYFFDANFPHRVDACSGPRARYTLSAFLGVLRNSDLALFS
ncbi:MAG TPA: hypothetical protein VMG08_01605 [Allosphingosinicella sp.]|nr:hypothetical protein [Allosphingosinicella sp.]